MNNRFLFIGQRLKYLRRKRALSQSEAAREYAIPFRTYQRYESGNTMPKEEVLLRIASKNDVTPMWILSGQSRVEADRVAEPGAVYGLDDVSARLVELLKQMSESGKVDVLNYAIKIQPYYTKHPEAKPPRPIPIDFTAKERYALRLYEEAEKLGLSKKFDEIAERLIEEAQERGKKKFGTGEGQ